MIKIQGNKKKQENIQNLAKNQNSVLKTNKQMNILKEENNLYMKEKK